MTANVDSGHKCRRMGFAPHSPAGRRFLLSCLQSSTLPVFAVALARTERVSSDRAKHPRMTELNF
jgi:hypothetical protein